MSGAEAAPAGAVAPELEAPRPVAGEAFSDAVTCSFGDERAGVFGLARIGLTASGASGLALVFSGRDTIAARAEGGIAVERHAWEAVAAAGVTTTVQEPLTRWTVRFAGDPESGGEGAFALELAALGAPAAMAGGGMSGYEQLCRVRGTARIGGRDVALDCLGQRGHQWGAPDWGRLGTVRTIGAWLGDDLAVLIGAFRSAKAKDHGSDEIDAVVLEGAAPAPVPIAEPLLSTAYDREGRQRRVGWELWPVDEESYARRGAGEVLCGTSLDLGRLRMDCAFFRVRMDGRTGVGRYDVLRRA